MASQDFLQSYLAKCGPTLTARVNAANAMTSPPLQDVVRNLIKWYFSSPNLPGIKQAGLDPSLDHFMKTFIIPDELRLGGFYMLTQSLTSADNTVIYNQKTPAGDLSFTLRDIVYYILNRMRTTGMYKDYVTKICALAGQVVPPMSPQSIVVQPVVSQLPGWNSSCYPLPNPDSNDPRRSIAVNNIRSMFSPENTKIVHGRGLNKMFEDFIKDYILMNYDSAVGFYILEKTLFESDNRGIFEYTPTQGSKFYLSIKSIVENLTKRMNDTGLVNVYGKVLCQGPDEIPQTCKTILDQTSSTGTQGSYVFREDFHRIFNLQTVSQGKNYSDIIQDIITRILSSPQDGANFYSLMTNLDSADSVYDLITFPYEQRSVRSVIGDIVTLMRQEGWYPRFIESICQYVQTVQPTQTQINLSPQVMEAFNRITCKNEILMSSMVNSNNARNDIHDFFTIDPESTGDRVQWSTGGGYNGRVFGVMTSFASPYPQRAHELYKLIYNLNPEDFVKNIPVLNPNKNVSIVEIVQDMLNNASP